MIADDDEQAALASAEDDWNEDSRGESRMTDAMFRDAIFQLADLWTESIDVDEYVSFLLDAEEDQSCRPGSAFAEGESPEKGGRSTESRKP